MLGKTGCRSFRLEYVEIHFIRFTPTDQSYAGCIPNNAISDGFQEAALK